MANITYVPTRDMATRTLIRVMAKIDPFVLNMATRIRKDLVSSVVCPQAPNLYIKRYDSDGRP